MWKALTADSIVPYALIGMTAVTGLVDAVSFLSLGHVFTANMTGNIVLLAFASTGVPQVSLARSITALLGFLAGAAVGGRIMAGANAVVQLRAAGSVFALEIVFLVGATLAALGYSVVSSPHFLRLYAMIAFTAIAMGLRNAAVRKLAIPDLTATVLTLTITGLAADSSLARGTNPRLQRRIAAVMAMFAGAALGSIILRHSVFMALVCSVVLSSLCSLALLISSHLPCARNAEKD
jgi:uncharacterized membrane protein YoaK (UPF0700 family)